MERLNGALEIINVEKRQRRLPCDNDRSGHRFAVLGAGFGPPDRCAGNSGEFDDLGASRRPDAVEKRQDDADPDALLNWQKQNRGHRGDDQGEFRKLGARRRRISKAGRSSAPRTAICPPAPHAGHA